MVFVFLTHPEFLESQSMPRFAAMLSEGMISKGHTIEVVTAEPVFFNLAVPKSLRKWMGYIDQYLLFPVQLKRRIKKASNDTLYVFTDHALGPWIPLVTNKAHVVHCHDFLAQQSALNKIPQNQTGWTGRRYQAFIRSGYSKAKNFISVSKKTQSDLHAFLGYTPKISEVVYNGLNRSFIVHDIALARKALGEYTGLNLSDGYILHVGGNQWYKNRRGVIEIYTAWRSLNTSTLPLIMIGSQPSVSLLLAHSQSAYKDDIYFFSGVTDELVRMAYSGARVLVFPSIAEGFGWPIVEAMASGCPVITTDVAPMTEVAGDGAYFIESRPYNEAEVPAWAGRAAAVVENVIALNTDERKLIIDKGLQNAKRFDTKAALDKIEEIYLKIVNDFQQKV